MFGTPFELFGTVHLITIAVVIITSIFLPKFYKNKSDHQISMMKKIIAGVIAAHVIISPYKDLYLLANPYDWRETIPLHMCDLSEIFLNNLMPLMSFYFELIYTRDSVFFLLSYGLMKRFL